MRVQDVGLAGAEDPDVLAWAAEHDRIVLTHDRATFPDRAYDRLTDGEPMTGVFLQSDRLSVGQSIDEVLLIVDCTHQAEWNGRVIHLPL